MAKRAGVSLATVSYVLNNGPRRVGAARRERVCAAAHELDYQPRASAPRRVLVIGVVVPDVTNAFFARAVQGIEDVLRPAGHLVVVGSSGEDPVRERHLIQSLVRRGVAGLVLTPCAEISREAGRLGRRVAPMVIMDREGGSTGLNRVTMDNYRSAFQAVRLLWESGHRRIGLVNGPDRIDTARERLRGYTEALAFAGLPFDPGLVQSGAFSFEHGLHGTRALLGLPEPPTAVFSSSTILTAGMMWALREHRLRVPDDIAVVGFGDTIWAPLVTPPLTVIEQPSRLMGETAARLLLAAISGEPSAGDQAVVLESRLILRESHWRVTQPALANGPVAAGSGA
ncbi:MAG TPA: LacI family DNA-binding transcriptional regulator [bacterium]|nr:LacI family DNA-binding transcriptional regulator [bacterium]